MTSADVAALITAIGVSIGATITAVSALMNARTNKHEQEELKAALAASDKRIAELEQHRITDKRDIILIGESLAQARADNAILAEAFNQLFTEFTEVTGRRPANLEALRRLQTIKYITGRLRPLE